MHYTDEQNHLHVELEAKECEIPTNEQARMQKLLQPLGEAVHDFPASDLGITAIYHPRSDTYHVEAKLRLPGQTLFTGGRAVYLDSAFQHCVRKLLRKVEAYEAYPDRRAAEGGWRQLAQDRKVVAPAEPDGGLLG